MSPSDLPPLDTHAHVAPDVTAPQVRGLAGAVVFAMTRSPAEAAAAARRTDGTLVWGWGAHPALPASVEAVTAHAAAQAVRQHVLIGEIGLDRKGPEGPQQAALELILDACHRQPVLLSVHSTGRTRQVLDLLRQRPHPGTVLHWYNGTPDEIDAAAQLGCYFSVNNAMDDQRLLLVPPHRMLPETDFPSSRRNTAAARPGDTAALERRLSDRDGVDRHTIRRAWYRNLDELARVAGATHRLPTALRDHLRHAGESDAPA